MADATHIFPNHEAVIAQQDKYIDSQIDIYRRILEKAMELPANNFDQTIQIANAIYQGYCLSDIEDAVRYGDGT